MNSSKILAISATSALAFGGGVAVMYHQAMQVAFDRGQNLDRIDVAVAPGADLTAVEQRLRTELGSGFIVEHPTRKGDRVYVHVLDSPDASLLLPPLPAAVRSARLLNGGRPVDVKTGEYGVVLTLPRDAVDPIDTIVVLELAPKAVR